MSLKKWNLIYVLLTFVLISGFHTVEAQINDCKSFDFNLAPNYQTGPNAFSFTSGDINGDGNVDVITSNFDVDAVSILYGDGVGGFTPYQNFSSGISVSVMTTGDLNKDGKTDLVAANTSRNQITVLLNNGQGGFAAPTVTTLPATVSEFYDLKIADFNGDGNPDVVGVTRQKLNFFLGNGQGGLELKTSLDYEGYKSRLAVGNFNSDNVPDLVITSIAERSSVWRFDVVLGNRSAAFEINNYYELKEVPSGVDVGDFNGDGLTDIVISADYPYQNLTPQTYYLQPWLGNGTGGFTAGSKVQMPFVNTGVVVGDFNGDGKIDLATNLGSIVAVANGIGDGTFQKQTYWTISGANALLSSDANRDGKTDLLILRSSVPNSFVSVLISLGANGFAAPKPIIGGGTDLTATDLNSDSYKDLIFAEDKYYGNSDEISLALNDKVGGLLPASSFDAPDTLSAIKTGDFNGDGKRDIVTAHSSRLRQIAVYLGNGTGSVGSQIPTTLANGITNLIVGDFNADGRDDVFAFDQNGHGYSLLSKGDGTFTIVADMPLQNYVSKLEKGDFNRDGKLDLIISNSSNVNLWLGDGKGQFTQSASSIPSLGDVVAGDFNGDGKLDLAGFADDGVKGVLGDGTGGFGASFSEAIMGGVSPLISADFNSDGFDDLAFISSDGRGSLIIIPSSGQTAFWERPIFYLVGGLSAPAGGFGSFITATDFNNDNKIDIGYTSRRRSSGIILNTSNLKPCLSVSDVTVTEGNAENVTATFTVKLSAPSLQDVRVNYSIENQTATAGIDFQNLSGPLLIPAGQTSGTIQVVVNGDLLDEPDETFVLHLTSPDNAALLKGDAIGTIIDNDLVPTLTVSNAAVVEAFSQSVVFRATLSAPSGKPISFRYTTSDGTAVAGKDYFAATSIVTVAPGQTSVNIPITVLGDNTFERDETFFLNIADVVNASIASGQATGTITNDDPVPTLNLFSGSFAEGDTGIATGNITVQLSNPTYLPVTLNVLTSDGTAIAGKDYIVGDTVVTIAPEQQTATTPLQVIGDTINEPNEVFNVNAYNVTNASIGTTQIQVIIIDDEPVSNDFDRDGKTDLAVFRPSDGTWYLLNSSTGSFTGRQYGISEDIPVSGDYNNDARTDITVWRPSSGTWYSTIANRTQQWGTKGDIPVAGDYDNDGRLDVAVFRPTTQSWYIQLSSTGANKFVQWGLETDTPVPADYDGDGKTDIAVYRPSTGVWYILRSGDNGLLALQWGLRTDKPVPADYDGDGRADIAVFRDGNWHVVRSSDNGITTFQWGIPGDKPVPGNYDGDDKTDFAIYRAGVWWIFQSSTNSYVTKQFGLSDDIPIPFVSNN